MNVFICYERTCARLLRNQHTAVNQPILKSSELMAVINHELKHINLNVTNIVYVYKCMRDAMKI